jgi:hypothetical protein
MARHLPGHFFDRHRKGLTAVGWLSRLSWLGRLLPRLCWSGLIHRPLRRLHRLPALRSGRWIGGTIGWLAGRQRKRQHTRSNDQEKLFEQRHDLTSKGLFFLGAWQ